MIQFRCNNCLNSEVFGSKKSSTIKHFNPKESIIIFENDKSSEQKTSIIDYKSLNINIKDIIECKKNINYIVKSLNTISEDNSIDLKQLIFCDKCSINIIKLFKEEIIYQRYILHKFNECYELEKKSINDKQKIENNNLNNDILNISEQLKELITQNEINNNNLEKLKLKYDNELKQNINNNNNYQNIMEKYNDNNEHLLNIIENNKKHIDYLKKYDYLENLQIDKNLGLIMNIFFQDFKEEEKYEFEKIKDYVIDIDDNKIYYNNFLWNDINFLLGEYSMIIHLILSINNKVIKTNYKIRAIGGKSYIINNISNVEYPLYNYNNNESIHEMNLGIKNFRQCISDIYKLKKRKPLYKMYDDKIIDKQLRMFDLILPIDENLEDYKILNKWLYSLKLLGKNIIYLS